METLVFVTFLVLIGYFLLIRPQQQRQQRQLQMLADLDAGDDVITIGGMYGEVVEIDDRSVLLEFYDGSQIRFLRTAISRRLDDDEEEEDFDDAEDDIVEGDETVQASIGDDAEQNE